MAKNALWLLSIFLLLSACGASDAVRNETLSPRNAELTIFADASLSDALDEIAERYREAAPWIRTRIQYGSSGELSRRIRDGAQGDLFLCATSEPMDALDGAFRGDLERNPDNADLLLEGSRVSLTRNQVVLAAPLGNPDGIRNFAHLSALIRRNGLLLATADAGDPLGVRAARIFEAYRLSQQDISDGFAFASDAAEAATRVKSGMVDAGILYRTDADGLLIVETADGDVTYCGAVLAESEQPLAASAFLESLTGAEASEIFLRAGFAPLSEAAPSGPYWEALLPEEPESESWDNWE